jgi:gas vesicle protein
MSICVNCGAVATFVYYINNNNSLLYCGKHLPKSLRNSPRVSTLTTEQTLASEIQNVSKVSSKKTKTVTIDSSDVVSEDVELNSTETETTEEEVANESEPGLG